MWVTFNHVFDIFECVRNVKLDSEEVNYSPGVGVYGLSDAVFFCFEKLALSIYIVPHESSLTTTS